MPKLDHSALANYAKKKKSEDGEKSGADVPAGSQAEIPVTSTSKPPSPEKVTPITVIYPEGPSPRKRPRMEHGSSASPASPQDAVIAGLESFKVDNQATAYLAGNSASVLLRALMGYATSSDVKVAEERDSLRSEVQKLKKTCSELKKANKDAEAARKNAEKELSGVQKEHSDLTARVSSLDGQVKELEMQKAELEKELKDATDSSAEKISALQKDVEELTGDCVAMFEDGYNYCIKHVKFLSPEFDTSELSFTKKIEDGKLVEAAP